MICFTEYPTEMANLQMVKAGTVILPYALSVFHLAEPMLTCIQSEDVGHFNKRYVHKSINLERNYLGELDRCFDVF